MNYLIFLMDVTQKTSMIKDYHNNNFDKIKHKHYQPTYYSPLKKILLNIRNSQESKCHIHRFRNWFWQTCFYFNKFFDNANNFAFGLDLESNYEPTFKEYEKIQTKALFVWKSRRI